MIELSFKHTVYMNSMPLFYQNQWPTVHYRPAYLNARQTKKLNIKNNNELEV